MDRGPPREEPLSLCISAHTARAYKVIKWLIPGPRGPFPDVVATGASLLTLPVPITQQVGGSNHSATVPIAFQSPQQAHWRADRQRSGLVGQELVSEAPTLTAGPDHALEEAAPADSSRLGRPVTESWGWAPPRMPERPLSTPTLQATDRLPSRLLPPMAKPPTCQSVSPGCGQCFITGLLPNRLPNRATCGNEGRTPAPALGGSYPLIIKLTLLLRASPQTSSSSTWGLRRRDLRWVQHGLPSSWNLTAQISLIKSAPILLHPASRSLPHPCLLPSLKGSSAEVEDSWKLTGSSQWARVH